MLDRIVIDDKSWLLYVTPSCKEDMKVWHKKGEPSPKKWRFYRSMKKILCIPFWNSKGVLTYTLPKGEEGTDEFSDACGHSRHTEEEDQVETFGTIASRSHFTVWQHYTTHIASDWEENWGPPVESFHASGEFARSRTFLLPSLPSFEEIFGRETVCERRGAEDDHLSMDERCGHSHLNHIIFRAP